MLRCAGGARRALNNAVASAVDSSSAGCSTSSSSPFPCWRSFASAPSHVHRDGEPAQLDSWGPGHSSFEHDPRLPLMRTLGEVVLHKSDQFMRESGGAQISLISGDGVELSERWLRPAPGAAAFTPEYEAQLMKQYAWEKESLHTAKKRFNADFDSAKSRRDGASMGPSTRLIQSWFEPFRDAIEDAQQQILTKRQTPFSSPAFEPSIYGPYLLLLEPAQLAVLTMHELMNQLLYREEGLGAAPTTSTVLGVGRAIMCQVNYLKLTRMVDQDAKRRAQIARDLELTHLNRDSPLVQEWERALADEVAPFEKKRKQLLKVWSSGAWKADEMDRHCLLALGESSVMWSQDTNAKLGAFLLGVFMDAAKIKVPVPGSPGRFTYEPALERVVDQVDLNTKHGTLVAHPVVKARLSDPEEISFSSVVKYPPMVVPPLPWTRSHSGGHLMLRSHVIRSRGAAQTVAVNRLDAAHAADPRHPGMTRIYAALNGLGSQGWRINSRVLEVVEAVWAAGGGVGDLPRCAPTPPPPPPDHNARSWLATSRVTGKEVLGYARDPRTGAVTPRLMPSSGSLTLYGGAVSLRESRDYYFKRKRIEKDNGDELSQRADLEIKLKVARTYRDEPVMYYPHSLDFRGRAYPLHPNMSHLSSDVCRGMLVFADARPLGARGLWWLHVQITNLYAVGGVDKLPLSQRYDWAVSQLAHILDSARQPLAGGRWWLQGENPFQLLSACMALADALALEDPTSYECRVPVQQDGSCNGLQHYAALARDAKGGAAVNLMPGERPGDVYSGVAALLRKQMESDAAAGNEEAALLLPVVDRKLVKQTVMTSVYGVTFVGAREQIAARLGDKGWTDDAMVFRCSSYAAKTTLDALFNMFSDAKATMQWLSACAGVVARSGQAMAWTTPLGLPVVQPYRNPKSIIVRTVLQRLNVRSYDDTLPVMITRQRTAFPPNYVHSLDSTHMMMAAHACRARGMAFAGVHDSFWTHAADVDQLNEIIRDTFVELHREPLLENLREEVVARHPALADSIPAVPAQGALDLEAVKESTYFFS